MTPAVESTPSSDDIFALFEWLLAPARLALKARARRVAFRIVGTGHAWLFDPAHDGPLFRRVSSIPNTVFTLTCTTDLLQRLVTDDDFALGEDDTASFDGDVDDLLALADVLDEQKNALGIRVRK
jgi:hypothetical protein